MKFIKNILIVLVLLLQVDVSFSTGLTQGQRILNRIKKEKERGDSETWEATGPTSEDIMAATKVENLAAKGSQEAKLINAVKNGDLEKVEALISAGAGLEARDNDNMTALMIAAKKGYTDIVSLFMTTGANVDAKDSYNLTALFNAVDKGHTEIVKLLIANGAAKNQTDFGMLFVAAVSKGNNEMVKALIVESASIGNDDLKTAYLFAQNKCSDEIVNTILKLQKESQN